MVVQDPERTESEPDAASVPDVPHATTTPASDRAGLGRAVVIGGIGGFVGVFVLVTILGASAGMELGGAMGLGVFVGLWGGTGFGAMLGGTIAFIRRLEDARG